MKSFAIVLVGSLLLTTTFTGIGIASEYERNDRSYHEQSEIHEIEMYGTVEKIPENIIGTWLVDGKEILVTKDTFIEEEYGKLAVGAYVEIKGRNIDNTFTARKIEIKGKHR